ncbi:ECs_2282 family putative zinc-binding protein [Salmonella enterica]|uniref:ECs_2282 family putative zinc-binding protein n=1 Tax=Salmonella enterica TaxID=28901 RepID=UPI003B589165
MSNLKKVRVSCPDCGNDAVEVITEFNFKTGTGHARCLTCNRVITNDDVANQVANTAAKQIEDLFNGALKK